MAALVTLAVAATHLRETNAANFDDVQLKAELASGLILDYLKDRANKTATITAASVASPTVVATEEAHGFVSGETAVISGSDSTPTIDGSHVVTVISSTTFSVPVAVTVAGTTASAEVEWTADTVPAQVQAAILLMLTHLYENRGDDMKADETLWGAIRRLLERSRDPAFA